MGSYTTLVHCTWNIFDYIKCRITFNLVGILYLEFPGIILFISHIYCLHFQTDNFIPDFFYVYDYIIALLRRIMMSS